jgi:hypothetical protein
MIDPEHVIPDDAVSFFNTLILSFFLFYLLATNFLMTGR